MSFETISKGKILIAEPFMVDPNFKRSVVLMCEHEEEGSLGFILNKSLDMKVNELIADFPEIDASVYYGGPVQTDTIHYIHNVGDVLDESMKVMNGVYWGGDFEKLKTLINSELVQPHNIRFFVGYSGWSYGQLKDEFELGSWLTENMDANYLFKIKPKTLWQKVLQDKGDAFSVIAQMPDSSSWN